MRDPERIDRILGLIRQLWKHDPDLRLLQLLSVLPHYKYYKFDLFYFEDSDLEASLKERLEILDSNG